MAQSEDDLLDDGEERLRRMCGEYDDRIYGVLQSDGHTASKLWASKAGFVSVLSESIQKVLVDGDKAEELATSIFGEMSLFARRRGIAQRVEQEKTRDPRLEKWLAEKLEHLPDNEFLKSTFHILKAKPEERAHGHGGREDVEKAMASLKRTYVGNAHETMYEKLCTLREEARAGVHYSCYTAIVQSSGTGKTRGVLEMSRLGVYICYCSTAAADSFACPPRSGQLANELSMTYNELDMALYFKAWFSVLVDEAINKKIPPEAWMDSQLHDTCPIRAAVFQRWKAYREADDFKKDVSKEDFDERNLDILEFELRVLKERLPDVPQGNLKILLVFDEARGLLPWEIGSSSLEDRAMVQDSSELQKRERAILDSPFYQMRRVSRAFFSHKHCFSVVMDTAAVMSNMQPNSGEEQSRKAKAVGITLLRPVYQVLNMELATPTEDLSPNKVFRIGRPLWSSRIERGESMEYFISFVEAKLISVHMGSFGGEQVDVYGTGGGVKMAESQAIALLSVTVGLEICPRSVMGQFLVASHTGIVTFISEDRQRLHVSHAVEPAVSEAATRILNSKGGRPFVAALERLNRAFLSGYCGSGDRGELACKTLLLMAGWRWLRHQKAEFYLTPIPVRDYLRSLLGLSEDEVNNACEGLSERSYVFFNSFILGNEKNEEEVTRKILKGALLRGCAIHFRAGNQVRAYDFVIPVLTPEGITFILVSAKNVRNVGNMRKEATKVLNPRDVNVERTHGVKVLTIFINVSEPNPSLVTPLPASKIWKPNELQSSYRKDPRQVAHMSIYGLERNFRGFELNSDGRVKEEEQLTEVEKQARKLLLELLVSVPDTVKEAGLFSLRAAEHVRKLVPEAYTLGSASDDITNLIGTAEARLQQLKHHCGKARVRKRKPGGNQQSQGKTLGPSKKPKV